jgi:hypothetical protein
MLQKWLAELWAKFGVWTLKVAAIIGVVLVVLKWAIEHFGPPTTKERDEKITDKIDEHNEKMNGKIKAAEEKAEEVKKSHSTIKDRQADRDKRDDKFFSN